MLYRIVLIYLTDNEQLMLYQSVCQSYFSFSYLSLDLICSFCSFSLDLICSFCSFSWFLIRSLFDLYSISIRYLYIRSKTKSSLLNVSFVITFVLTIDFINISKLYYYVITFVFSIDFLPSSSFRFFFVSICTRRGEVSEYFRLLQFFYLFDIFQTFFY